MCFQQRQQRRPADGRPRVAKQFPPLGCRTHRTQRLPAGIEDGRVRFSMQLVQQIRNKTRLSRFMHGQHGGQPQAGLRMPQCDARTLRQSIGLPVLPRAMRENPDSLNAQVERRGRIGSQRVVQIGRKRRDNGHASQRPHSPCFLIFSQLAFSQSREQLLVNGGLSGGALSGGALNGGALSARATPHEFVLGVDAADRQRAVEIGEQFIDRKLFDLPDRLRLHRWRRVLPTNAEYAAFIRKLPVFPLSSVAAAPAQHPHSAIGTELQIGRSEQRRTALYERREAAAGGTH